MVCRGQTGGAEERPGRDDPEQGGPVFDEALGAAEQARGEGRWISDTYDCAAMLVEYPCVLGEVGG